MQKYVPQFWKVLHKIRNNLHNSHITLGAATLSDFLLAEFLFSNVLTSLSMAGCHLFSVTGLPLFYHAFITDR
jgi:hypothetical protein